MRITLYSRIWSNIRIWQKKNSISETQLAADLRVDERTLKEYDKSAHNLTLAKIDNLLTAENISLNVILNAELNLRFCKNGHFFWDIVSENTDEKK